MHVRSILLSMSIGLSFTTAASAQVLYDDGVPPDFGIDKTYMQGEIPATTFRLAQDATITGASIYTSYYSEYVNGENCTYYQNCDPNLGLRGQFDWTLYVDTPDHLPGEIVASGSVVPQQTYRDGDVPVTEDARYDFALPDLHVSAGTTYWLSLLNTDSTGSLGDYSGGLMWEAGARGAAPDSSLQSAVLTDNRGWVHMGNDERFNITLQGTFDEATTTPEPTSAALVGGGLALLVPAVRRRKRKSR